jgi:hypothetical protein
MVNAVFAHDEELGQYNIVVANYNADPKTTKGETVEIRTTLNTPPGSPMNFRSGTYQEGLLKWSDWNTLTTSPRAGSRSSELALNIEISPFSFQKIEIKSAGTAPMASHKTTHLLTVQKTGTKAEVVLIDVKGGMLICSESGQRLEIPVSSLIEEEVEFLKEWMKTK